MSELEWLARPQQGFEGQRQGYGPRRAGRAAMHAGALAALLAGGEAKAQYQYEVTIIEGPKCPDFENVPTLGTAVDSSGRVAGYYCDCLCKYDHAFDWTAEAGLIALPMPPGVPHSAASDANDNGWTVGTMMDAEGVFAFVYDGSRTINLGTLPGGTESQALAVNNAGQVVGHWGNTVTGPSPLALLWQDGKLTDISADFGTPNSRAQDINDAGQVTGWMGSNPLTDGNAFIWQDGSVTILPSISGAIRSEGFGINHAGHVVGMSKLLDPETNQTILRGFFWRESELTEICPLPGFSWCGAIDINADDAVVGRTWNSEGNVNLSRGFLWKDGVLTDLNDLIAPSTDLFVDVAWAINDAGQITGWGTAAGGSVVAYLLTPPRSPPGDIDGDCVVGIADLLGLLGAWGICPQCTTCNADLNGDCSVGIVDLSDLLANWG